jgi:predicted DNA binding CopG/RHH family protein/uncharacterized DUF497 family protein
MEVDGFDWDEGNREKCRQHGVSIAEIEGVFRKELRIAPDMAHSMEEDRFIAVGKTSRGRHVFVAFTFRTKAERRLIRPVTQGSCTKRRLPPMKKRNVPRLKTDKQAEQFLARDLADLDFSQFRPVRFEFEKKGAQINMRVPKPLLDAVKAKARARGIPYTRLIRETLERSLITESR